MKQTYHGQSIGNLAEENLQRLNALLLTEFIATVLFETALCLFGRQTGLDVGLKLLDNVIDGQCVGGRRHGLVGLPRDMVLQLLLLLL